jgi:hypothetical protein
VAREEAKRGKEVYREKGSERGKTVEEEEWLVSEEGKGKRVEGRRKEGRREKVEGRRGEED